MKYAKARDKNEPSIIGALRDMHCHVETMHTPVDLLCFCKLTKTFFLVEVKNPERRGKPEKKKTDIQRAFFDSTTGGLRTVVETIDDVVTFVQLVVRGEPGR